MQSLAGAAGLPEASAFSRRHDARTHPTSRSRGSR